VSAGNVDLLPRHHILNNLSIQDIYPWLNTETQPKLNPYYFSGFDLVNSVLHRVGLVRRLDMDEPVSIRPLGFPAHNRIHDLFFYLFGVVGLGQIDQMSGIFTYGFIRTKRV